MIKKFSICGIFLLLPLLAVDLTTIKLRPEPWLTEKANYFLSKLMKRKKNAKVLEFGSGASTIWFCRRTKKLTSIEHDPIFMKFIKKRLSTEDLANIKYFHHPLPYHKVTKQYKKEYFDLILIDGYDKIKCLENSLRHLKPGGIIMLNNAERKEYQTAYELLNDWELTITEQTKPDKYGYWYKGWQTSWWQKPHLH